MSQQAPSSTPERVDFYFDPICPYAYQTSLWIRDVRRQTGLEITWKFFSLEEINRPEGKKHPWEREISYGWTPMRIGAFLRRKSMDSCDKWYAAIGKALHLEGKRPYERDTALELLASIGEEASVWDAALGDPTTHDEVRKDHEHAVNELAGFGVPIIVAPGTRAIFGPVVLPPPMGAEALELWDITLRSAKFPGLYEMKRPKTAGDLQHIAEVFNPYLRGREWETIQKPAL